MDKIKNKMNMFDAHNEEKAEKYLLKAGEEALRSSASTEAIHYFEEALQLYNKRKKTDADPEKKAMIEKNIAIALYNRGRFNEAILHFDNTLVFYGEKPITNSISLWFTFMLDAMAFLFNIYFPIDKSKKNPTKK